MTSRFTVFAVVVAFTLTCSRSLAELTVVPFAVAVEPMWTAKFNCVPDNSSLVVNTTWTFNGTEVTRGPRITVGDGMLIIANATYSDAGDYTCNLGNDTSKGKLIVYNMPDYMTEGLIVGFISLGLFVILVVGVVIDFVKQEKEHKKRHKARREKAARRTDISTKY